MKQFKVTTMVPHEQIITAIDMQEAHNKVSKMISTAHAPEFARLFLHSIVEVEPETIEAPVPTAA